MWTAPALFIDDDSRAAALCDKKHMNLERTILDRPRKDHLRERRPWLWYLTLLGPLVLSSGILLALFILHGAALVRNLLLTALAVFFFFGRFAILGGDSGTDMEQAARFFSPGELALLVLYMDTMVALLLSCHIGVFFRLPFLGDRLRMLAEDGHFILHSHPWMRRATFAGIVIFVTFPLAATGSVGGSIFGRLLGMSRLATFTGAFCGSLIGCGAMYFGAALINTYLDRDNPWLVAGGVAFVVALVLVLNRRYRQMKRQWLADRAGNRARVRSSLDGEVNPPAAHPPSPRG